MGTYVEIDGKLYVTKEDYLNIVKYYENSLSAERKGAKEEIAELEEENENLNKQIEQFKKGVKAGTKIIERLEEENEKLKEENKKFDKLKIRVYENLHKDIWKEYQKFCEKNNI